MISTNELPSQETEANKIFSQFALENTNSINENEFNRFIEQYLGSMDKKGMIEDIKREKLFYVYINKNQTTMNLEEFSNAYKDINFLVKGGSGDNNLDIDFNLDGITEQDLMF